MRILTVLFFGFLNFAFVNGQTYSSVTSDKEIYDFLNWMFANDKRYREEPKLKRKQIYHGILNWDSTNFITRDTAYVNRSPNSVTNAHYLYKKIGGTDSIFKPQDRDFLFKQFTAIKDSVWHGQFSKSRLLTNENQKRPNRYYISIPLFSIDRKYVIIHRVYFCGSLCAHGGYYVYRRIGNNKWEYFSSVNTWMS